MKREKAYLPWEIMGNILSRLAVKTLLRLRCVCKQWRNIIHDPSFITMHTAAQNHDISYILYSYYNNVTRSSEKNPYCLYYNPCVDEIIQLDLPLSKKKVKIHGSCNGILCLALDDCHVFFLWNPSIKKLKPLAPNPTHAIHDIRFSYCAIGFGLIPSNKNKVADDDYKVVTISYSFLHIIGRYDDNLPPPRVEIYTLSTNSWKSIDDAVVPAKIDRGNSGALVNGAVHWFCAKKNIILSFDLEEEVFGEIMLPNYPVDGIRHDDDIQAVLGNFRETLSLIAYSDAKPCVCYMWEMKEYGVVESWTRLFTVQIAQNIHRPLCLGNKGFLLKHGFGSILLFECTEGQLWRPVPNCCFLDEAFVYTETLVLLNENDDDNILKKLEEDRKVSRLAKRDQYSL